MVILYVAFEKIKDMVVFKKYIFIKISRIMQGVNMRAAVILGAGFSKNSGLPIQSEIPELLIENQEDSLFEAYISQIIQEFYEDVFGFFKGEVPPSLDDLLTCIDISTNSGHHLGIKYSPLHLRAIRRFIIYKLFKILEDKYRYSEAVFNLVSRLLKSYSKVDFIVLNWDTVLEKYINNISPSYSINYCNGGEYIRNVSSEKALEEIKIIKIHGSSNWLYCDNCRVLFNDTFGDIPLIKKAGFKATDFELLGKSELDLRGFIDGEECLICGDQISSHIATFNFRKSFKENSFPQLWDKAEEALTISDKWIFIGYSLPQADYEFKHLLKISELKLMHRKKKKPDIDVVLLNSTATAEKYISFFGSKIVTIYNGGINEYLKYV